MNTTPNSYQAQLSQPPAGIKLITVLVKISLMLATLFLAGLMVLLVSDFLSQPPISTNLSNQSTKFAVIEADPSNSRKVQKLLSWQWQTRDFFVKTYDNDGHLTGRMPIFYRGSNTQVYFDCQAKKIILNHADLKNPQVTGSTVIDLASRQVHESAASQPLPTTTVKITKNNQQITISDQPGASEVPVHSHRSQQYILVDNKVYHRDDGDFRLLLNPEISNNDLVQLTKISDQELLLAYVKNSKLELKQINMTSGKIQVLNHNLPVQSLPVFYLK